MSRDADAALASRLAELVAYDTQNPMGDERPMVEKLAEDLRGLGTENVEILTTRGHHSVFARFGERPRLLLNAHVDTVPANTGYSTPPHQLTAKNGRLYGLGSADTKGAIAAILEALAAHRAAGGTLEHVAVLFSGDEEKGGGCTRAFLEAGHGRGLERAIVCEPTSCRVGHRHRGIGAAEVVATSPGGHSSRADELPSPMVALARVALALDEMGRRYRGVGPEGFKGLCMNIAGIDGGLAFNVIPARARLSLSLRPGPGADLPAILAEAEEVARRAAAPDAVTWAVDHANPPFQTRDLPGFVQLMGDVARAPIDLAFWTEAALFADAGVDAVVYGPGDIAQAHAADEYVELRELVAARDLFRRVIAS